jgi:hypothetical protein
VILGYLFTNGFLRGIIDSVPSDGGLATAVLLVGLGSSIYILIVVGVGCKKHVLTIDKAHKTERGVISVQG